MQCQTVGPRQRFDGFSLEISQKRKKFEMLLIGSCIADGQAVLFRHPIVASIHQGDFGFEADIAKLSIREFGDTKEECLSNLAEALAFRWIEYAQEEDEAMDSDAQRIARYMRDLVLV